VPINKLLLGAAFYSHKWTGVNPENNGFGSASESGCLGGYSFAELYRNYINKNGFTRYWDDAAKAPYLFGGNEFISYDDEESIRYKCEYVKDNNMLGIMYWEHSCDDTRLLLKTIDDTL
jgi:chitinase